MEPFVSCIMPTANRRKFVPHAIARFLAQDYKNAELVIIDDGEDPIDDLVPKHPALRYMRTARHHSLGLKRNAACEVAHGEIIMHWDDDDWYANHWVRIQAEALYASNAAICGLNRALFFDPRVPAAWEYFRARWLCGATLCYRRDYWKSHPFADKTIGEDTDFVAAAQPDELYALSDNSIFVALAHDGNTSPKKIQDFWWCPGWQRKSVDVIKSITGGDWPSCIGH